ncbi:MAG: hypothetical protein RIB63_23390, partial [Fulvivirga sp.]
MEACTIFSGKDKHEHIWVGNNEDNPFSFFNYINIFPKTSETLYGYYTLSYATPENGENFMIQGGMNEAGLFYDMNTLDMSGKEYLIKDLYKKKSFPGGDDKILSHILSNFETVDQVVDFFENYWFDNGFKGAQIHLADRKGTFAMISPDGIKVLKNQRYQISTNFSICGNEETYGCWRYPIAKQKIENEVIGFSTFKEICENTAQKDNVTTIYSNIQNLNTGDIWFYFGLDYNTPYKTTMRELLSKGRVSLLMRDLFIENPFTIVYDVFLEEGGRKAFEKLKSLNLEEDLKKQILLAFINSMIGNDFNMDLQPFLEEYLTYNPPVRWMHTINAIYHYNQGDKDRAIAIIKNYKKDVPETSLDVEGILNRFDGKFDKDANVTIELNGYQDAKSVFVKGLPIDDFNFLDKGDGKWIGKFKLGSGIYNYSFVVDGKEVFDNKTPITVTKSIWDGESSTSHQLTIDLSPEIYETKIRVKVPNKDDVVYIAGNQPNLTYWSSSIRLTKVSDCEREITVNLHYPALFKFTRGNWDTEAVVENN